MNDPSKSNWVSTTVQINDDSNFEVRKNGDKGFVIIFLDTKLTIGMSAKALDNIYFQARSLK